MLHTCRLWPQGCARACTEAAHPALPEPLKGPQRAPPVLGSVPAVRHRFHESCTRTCHPPVRPVLTAWHQPAPQGAKACPFLEQSLSSLQRGWVGGASPRVWGGFNTGLSGSGTSLTAAKHQDGMLTTVAMTLEEELGQPGT